MNNGEHINGRARVATGLVAAILLTAYWGCSPDPAPPPPQNTSVAGTWEVICEPPNNDCYGFTFTFSPNGDIINSDLPGLEGVVQGTASIANGVLTILVNEQITFVGTLDALGNIAKGTLTDHDLDGAQSTTLDVTATRQT